MGVLAGLVLSYHNNVCVANEKKDILNRAQYDDPPWQLVYEECTQAKLYLSEIREFKRLTLIHSSTHHF